MIKDRFIEYFGGRITGQKQKAIGPAVAEALTSFCEQEPEFEQAIEQSGKTFQECLDEVVKGCGSCLSDIEAYRRAVKFYFSTATVSFRMTIDLCGDNGAAEPRTTAEIEKDTLSVSLDDLLDF